MLIQKNKSILQRKKYDGVSSLHYASPNQLVCTVQCTVHCALYTVYSVQHRVIRSYYFMTYVQYYFICYLFKVQNEAHSFQKKGQREQEEWEH